MEFWLCRGAIPCPPPILGAVYVNCTAGRMVVLPRQVCAGLFWQDFALVPENGRFCCATRPVLPRETNCLARWNSPFRILKRTVQACKTARVFGARCF